MSARPRLGFVGVGWIGRHRMNAIHESGVAEIAAVADAAPDQARQAAAAVGAEVASVDELLGGDRDLDGVVIATPNALHVEQSLRALRSGLAVFCQKPLGRTAEETTAVVHAARDADRLLGVDLSYRHVEALRLMHREITAGAIGRVFAADFTFHNAYGPDKPWFTDPALAGGGCMLDLGIHLVDLALWLLAPCKVEAVTGRLFSRGEPLTDPARVVDDYALATLDLSNGGVARIATSWFLHAGQDAVIAATVYGTDGALECRNVAGSFYDFELRSHRGTSTEVLSRPPDDWGGRAAVAWAAQLASGARFDPAVEKVADVARVIDAVYSR